MFSIYDLFQDSRIREAEQQAGSARSVATRTEGTEQRLTRELETLTLACAAMWTLLSEKCGITPADLVAKMTEIDLQDGVLDGRLAPQGRACEKCGRVMSAQRRQCMYCGHEQVTRVPFPTI